MTWSISTKWCDVHQEKGKTILSITEKECRRHHIAWLRHSRTLMFEDISVVSEVTQDVIRFRQYEWGFSEDHVASCVVYIPEDDNWRDLIQLRIYWKDKRGWDSP